MSETDETKTRPPWLTHVLETAPSRPGCYLMKDRVGEIVYVGKAQNLKQRLSQYFQPGSSDTRFFVSLLDRVLGSIDLIVSANAKEALILENELIKRHQPRFNVKLKDDKNFLNIRIGTEHDYPRLEVVRQRKKDGASYFGPYASASAIRQTLKVVNRHFQLRTCSDSEFARRIRPCIEYQIGRCPAPCVFPLDRDIYQQHIEDVKTFLSGKTEPLLARLREQMLAASEALSFELAAHYRDQIDAIERSMAPQNVVLRTQSDFDVIGLYREGEDAVIQVSRLIQGVLIGSRSYPIKGSLLPDEALIDGFIGAYYDGSRPIPDWILVPLALEEAETWSELLSEARGKKATVHHPQRGDKTRLIASASETAHAAFMQRKQTLQDHEKTLLTLKKRLRLPVLPRRIECFDISNIQGTDPVAAMTVAIDGVLKNSEYRRYRIRTVQGANDYAMMLEVLKRRFRRVEKGEAPPDLVLVDGGKGQLRMAQEALAELGIEGIALASIAEERAVDRLPVRGVAEKPSSEPVEKLPDRVFRPGAKNAMSFRANSNALYLLQQLRDEAHRVAVRFHRQQRKKRTLHSVLDEIPGVGPKRRNALLKAFGSVAQVRQASVSALATVPGISEGLAGQIWEFLHEPDTPAPESTE